MSATQKKQALRGGGGGPAPVESAEDNQEPEDLDDEGLESLDKAPLPDRTVKEENGDWVYTLAHPLSDGSTTPSKVRVPKHLYAKDIRNASRGKTEAETIFYMLASCSGLSTHVLDMLDARDYMVLNSLMNRRALGNSRAVLASLEGKGR